MRLIDADALPRQKMLEACGNGKYEDVDIVYGVDVDAAPTVIHLCKVCKYMNNPWYSETCDGCTGRECNFSPIDPIKHGRWLYTDTNTCECSICHTCEPYPFSEFEWCPNCGARMDKEADDEID